MQNNQIRRELSKTLLNSVRVAVGRGAVVWMLLSKMPDSPKEFWECDGWNLLFYIFTHDFLLTLWLMLPGTEITNLWWCAGKPIRSSSGSCKDSTMEKSNKGV